MVLPEVWTGTLPDGYSSAAPRWSQAVENVFVARRVAGRSLANAGICLK